MSRQFQRSIALFTIVLMVTTGCAPQQPFYFHEDGDLSHYVGMATDIEYPDVESETLEEVSHSFDPLTLSSQDAYEIWDLTLEEAIKHALANSKVLRSLGGRFATTGDPSRPQVGQAPNALLTNPEFAQSIYDPAVQETSTGRSGAAATGVEAALSQFDADFTTSVFWEKNDRPANVAAVGINPFATVVDQDLGEFQAQLRKTAASGTHFFINNLTQYDQTIGSPIRLFPSAWTTHIEAGFRQPLLQGAGVQYNRIAGPWAPIANDEGIPFTEVGTPQFDGVVLARINQDIELADFEQGVQDFVSDVENAYWELYFAYRNLESRKVGLKSALETWRRIHALYEQGLKGGEAEQEAQAREQYFNFRAQVQTSKANLYRAENQLRYIMGLATSDGRLIRPADEPTTAPVAFDWRTVLDEGLVRSIPLRQQKWRVKQRELELIAAKNHLLPRLDAVGRYRWVGFGDDLIDSNSTGRPPLDNAWQTLTDGNFQEWQLGVQLSIPLGFREELARVRHHQLLLARDKAVLQEQELELSHQLAEGIRDLDTHYQVTQTNFNRRVAAEKQVRAVRTAYEAGTVTLDLLLDAQRRLADAESAYFRSLVDYNRAIMQLHLRKGTLLEYNDIYLAEGPWPGKAYFDAHRLARRRDASKYLDYGFTRPKVFSRGPSQQHGGPMSDGTGQMVLPEQIMEEMPVPEPQEVSPDAKVRRASAQFPVSTSEPSSSGEVPDASFDWDSLVLEEKETLDQ